MIVPQGNICFNFFSNQNHFIVLFNKLATYHWKGLKKNYNFVVGSTSIKTHMQKLCSQKVSNIIIPWGNMVSNICFFGELGPFPREVHCFSRNNHVLKEKEFKLFRKMI